MKSKHLKKMRELSGLTQVQLGEKLGLPTYKPNLNKDRVDCVAICYYETGRKKIGFELACQWANACGFTINTEYQILTPLCKLSVLLKEEILYYGILKGISGKFENFKVKSISDYTEQLGLYWVDLDEYFHLLEISEKYQRILKIINE